MLPSLVSTIWSDLDSVDDAAPAVASSITGSSLLFTFSDLVFFTFSLILFSFDSSSELEDDDSLDDSAFLFFTLKSKLASDAF
jgi:hypothetical protein